MKRRAFTFVEMLIVTAMLAVISLAIYKNLDSGLRIWHRVNTQIPEEDLSIFFDRFSTDLRNSIRYTSMNFLGTSEHLEFPTLVESTALEARTVGRVIYSYGYMSNSVKRESRDFSQLYREASGTSRQYLSGVEHLEFSYYYYDDKRRDYTWSEGWAGEDPPLAVRVEIRLKDDTDDKRFVRTVSIPIA